MGKNIPTMAGHLSKLVLCLVVVMNTHQVLGDVPVDITFVTDAEKIGAVCNDGSAAAYYHLPGTGEGVNNWFIFLNGGGWCGSDRMCATRLKTPNGSSKPYKTLLYETIPDFNNWNRVELVYCDSSSFMGEADHPNITTRGARIFDAVMNELLQKGLASATDVLFSGGSAGGLAALLHCDGFRALLPQSSRVKCVIDSGFFIHAPTLHGAKKRAGLYAGIAEYHGFANKLPSSCTSRMSNPSLCLFPEYFIKDIKTPLFLVESKFDNFQMRVNHLRDDKHLFDDCVNGNLARCTPDMFQSMKDWGVAVTGLLKEIRDTTSIGMFVDPCMGHTHMTGPKGWTAHTLRNKTIAQAVADWYFDRDTLFREIDFDTEFPIKCPTFPM